MINTIASTQQARPDTAHLRASSLAPARHADEAVFARSTVAGRFSLFENTPFDIDAETGLLIRVNAGCLWTPHPEESCSVGIGAGEQFVVRHVGRLTVFAMRGTEIELVWPSAKRSVPGLH